MFLVYKGLSLITERDRYRSISLESIICRMGEIFVFFPSASILERYVIGSVYAPTLAVRRQSLPIYIVRLRIGIRSRSALAFNSLDIGHISTANFHYPHRCRVVGFTKIPKLCIFYVQRSRIFLSVRHFRNGRRLRIPASKLAAVFGIRSLLSGKYRLPDDTNRRTDRARIIYRSQGDPWVACEAGKEKVKMSLPNTYPIVRDNRPHYKGSLGDIATLNPTSSGKNRP